VACHLSLLCPIQADGRDVTRLVPSLAGEHPWVSAGRWEVLLSHPSRTLLGVSASCPTPQPLRDVPVHVPTGVCTGPMPVIVGPPADQRVAWLDHLTGPGRWLGCDRGSHLPRRALTRFGDGRVRHVPPYVRIVWPRQSTPWLICVMRVLVDERAKPRSRRKCSTTGVTSSASRSGVLPVMRKSSV
jgi:hypothetical protein